MATHIIDSNIRNWIAFLRCYASRRIHGIQAGMPGKYPSLVLLNGPKVQWGYPTLAVELDFVLNEERETVRSVIAQRLMQARREFRRKVS
jgi:hypothetical protein